MSSDASNIKLWTKDGFIDDSLTPEKGAALMSPEEATGKLGSGTANVLVLHAGDEAGGVAGRISEFDAVFVEFPAFSDGRGFSTARVLRDKYGFTGQIRARGKFILDQIPLMLRVGFDHFEISHEPTIERLENNDLSGISLYMQPALGPEVRAGERAWARRAES
ncbi:MAG: DUF934 domain-containing protein [Rhizobiaceae bacterium]